MRPLNGETISSRVEQTISTKNSVTFGSPRNDKYYGHTSTGTDTDKMRYQSFYD